MGFWIIFFCHFRGRGPLKSTMDVINAAKKISEAGTKLDKLSRAILDMVRQSCITCVGQDYIQVRKSIITEP